ncbi:cytochrome c oxidase subunit II [Novimethylophilus kurashikiensis]|uniref:Cytochrome aa3 subunit 2 n=1 Tax=Novimethylophilus kurashikiensis TaxID=1825523 RepID=A0A2R5F878_9PROT|nr:cytochrome c oxidase subunit II [Novimethylophilus kurashikiensis]GBG12834.1 cytochrome c oxidase subunit II [Novimethylophilus kurashikiensis]
MRPWHAAWLVLWPGWARAATPMSYLQTFGPAGDPVTRLNWGLMLISIAVCVIIAALVLMGILRRRPPLVADAEGRLPVEKPAGGIRWIYIGVGISTVVLLACAVWTAFTLSAVASPANKTPIEVEIDGHQWWWGATYTGAVPSEEFVTANEVHIPVGQPVRFKLVSTDVIHSFWVPQLGGKTDVIPGQTNYTWLQADRPGVYRGQCGEYCGAQHAHMALYVVAEPQEQFTTWKTAQLAAANESTAPGAAVFQARCSVCHTVRGTQAHGALGPDLTHLMSRSTIAAGLLPNNAGGLSGWILNPQALKPGTRMPPVGLQPEELHDVVAYLQTLK